MAALRLFLDQNIQEILNNERTLEQKGGVKKGCDIWKKMSDEEKKPYFDQVEDTELLERVLSGFEKPEKKAKPSKSEPKANVKPPASAAGKRVYRCGVCRQTGHTRKKCGALVLHQDNTIKKTIKKKPMAVSSAVVVSSSAVVISPKEQQWMALPPPDLMMGMHDAVLQLQQRVSLSEKRNDYLEGRMNNLEEIMTQGKNLPQPPPLLASNLLTY
jgi:hypothetical protein